MIPSSFASTRNSGRQESSQSINLDPVSTRTSIALLSMLGELSDHDVNKLKVSDKIDHKLVNTLESHPDQWFRRNVQTEIRNSAKILANFIGADENDLVFVQNATTGINSVLRSLELHDSDGVLVLSLHYSPILTTLRRTCEYKQEIIDLKEYIKIYNDEFGVYKHAWEQERYVE